MHSVIPTDLLLRLLLFPLAVSAAFDCTFDIPPHHFNLVPLGGLHTFWTTTPTPPSIENTTVFINLCGDLEWQKDVFPDTDRCEDGTQGESPPPPPPPPPLPPPPPPNDTVLRTQLPARPDTHTTP